MSTTLNLLLPALAGTGLLSLGLPAAAPAPPATPLGNAPGAPSLPEYAVTDLGTLGVPDIGTAPGSFAADINKHGVVVGHSVVDEYTEDLRAFQTHAGGLVPLPPVGGDPHSLACAINGKGEVVGTSLRLGQGTTTAVLWSDGVPSILGSFQPRDIAFDGRVVGEAPADASTIDSRPVLWSLGGLTDLGDLGGVHGSAAAIAGDRVVGTSTTAAGTPRAFLWQGGPLIDLGTLGGPSSYARGIDLAGHVVGTADTAGGQPHAFVFELDAVGQVVSRTDLGVLGGQTSHAFGVGDDGTVVGTSDARAFRWRADDGLVDLNTRISPHAGWHLERATAVNTAGQIVGSGMHAGRPRAFLLTPTFRRAPDAAGAPVK